MSPIIRGLHVIVGESFNKHFLMHFSTTSLPSAHVYAWVRILMQNSSTAGLWIWYRVACGWADMSAWTVLNDSLNCVSCPFIDNTFYTKACDTSLCWQFVNDKLESLSWCMVRTRHEPCGCICRQTASSCHCHISVQRHLEVGAWSVGSVLETRICD